MSLLHELWLCEVCNYEPEQIYKYLNYFGSAENTYFAKASKYKKNKEYSVLEKILKADRSLSTAERILEDCKRQNIHLMSVNDDDYPELLKNGYLPPRVLFIKGERININEYLPITIVGSRAATRNGKLMAYELAHKLTLSGCLIVSGMARGIDTEAHKGALEAGGKTIAFLAGGVDVIYPAENHELYYEIMDNGAIFSERPPKAAGRDYYYQQRNRIMAALSYGTIFVEGGDASGSSITAKHSTDASRDLFAVPGNPMVKQSALPNKLLKDGAKLTLSYEDVIEEYLDKYPHLLKTGIDALKPLEESVAAELDYDLDEIDRVIIDYIKDSGEAVHPDEICESCNIPINTVSGKLTLLMMSDIISLEPGNKYILTRR